MVSAKFWNCLGGMSDRGVTAGGAWGGPCPPEGVSGKFWGWKREEKKGERGKRREKEGRRGEKKGKRKEEGERERKERESTKNKGKGEMRKKVNGDNFWFCPRPPPWQPVPVTPLVQAYPFRARACYRPIIIPAVRAGLLEFEVEFEDISACCFQFLGL